MFRVLPYVIIILFGAISWRGIEMFDSISNLNIYDILKNIKSGDISAAEPKPAQKESAAADKSNDNAMSAQNMMNIDTSRESRKMECVTLLTAADFNYGEIDALYKLRKRRVEMKASQDWINVKAASISAVNADIDQKLRELEVIQKKLSLLIEEYKKQGDEKLIRLARIYENMKPSEAARIFNNMPLSSLISITLNMKEQRLAAVIAEMDTKKVSGLSNAMTNKEISDLIDIKR